MFRAGCVSRPRREVGDEPVRTAPVPEEASNGVDAAAWTRKSRRSRRSAIVMPPTDPAHHQGQRSVEDLDAARAQLAAMAEEKDKAVPAAAPNATARPRIAIGSAPSSTPCARSSPPPMARRRRRPRSPRMPASEIGYLKERLAAAGSPIRSSCSPITRARRRSPPWPGRGQNPGGPCGAAVVRSFHRGGDDGRPDDRELPALARARPRRSLSMGKPACWSSTPRRRARSRRG